MDITIADVESAWLEAKTEFESVMREVEMEFYLPVGLLQLALLTNRAADIEEAAEALAPGHLDAVRGLIERIRRL